MEIMNRSGEVIFKSRHTTTRRTVIAAIEKGAYLRGADLGGANLREATLCDAYFEATLITFRGKAVKVNFTDA